MESRGADSNQMFNQTNTEIEEKLKFLKKLSYKLVKVSGRIYYLTRCKNLNLTPKFLNKNFKHITFTNFKNNEKFFQNLKQFNQKTLLLLIKDSFGHKNFIQQKIINIKNFFDKISNQNLITNILKQNIYHLNKFKTKLFNNLDKKINNLLKNHNNLKNQNLQQVRQENETKDNSNNWLKNLTNTVMTTNIKEVLSLGPKFNTSNPNNYKQDIEQCIINIEDGINKLDDEIKNNTRAKIVNILTNYKNKVKNPKYNKLSSENETLVNKIKETKTFIKNNPDIIITQADKSNTTVIMYQLDYKNKMENLLNDNNTYDIVKKDPTTIIQNKNNKLIKNLYNNNFINETTLKQLICNNGTISKIYGLTKLHKINNPLRPIVATYNSPTYKTAKYLANILSNLTKNHNNLTRDSWSFKRFIDNLKIPKNHKLFSLDVVSLYTNIPLELAIKTINNNWNKIKNFTNIPKPEFTELIKFVLENTYFTYNNKIYYQKFGVPMGSPISCIIANLVLIDIEDTIIKQNKNISAYKRYVDDIFITTNEDEIVKIQQQFNNYHHRLKFTIESESDQKSINFLDITLIRIENKIITNWFRKETKTTKYTNFKSQTYIKYKISIINNLVDRAIKLSDKKFHYSNIKLLKNILMDNNYPLSFINKYIKKRLNKIKQQNYNISNNIENCQTQELQSKIYTTIPFIPNLSEKIKNELNKVNIKVSFKNNNTFKKYFYHNLKDKTETMVNSNLIYQINCNDCNGCYIGQTKQYLNKRISQHKQSIKTKTITPNLPNTALAKHSVEMLHNFNFNEPKILSFETNLNKRLITESLEIKKNKNSINFKTDIDNLNAIYFNLVT